MAKTPRTKTPPRWRALWSAFWDGFSRPSSLAAGVALTSFALTLGATLWFFSPGTLAGPMGQYLPRSAKDAHGFATLRALQLAEDWVDQPTVLAFGSSTIAQSLGTGRTLTGDLRQATGQDWQFLTFAAPEQSPLDQMALLDTALAGHRSGGPPVIVLLSASALRMSWTVPRMLRPSFVSRIGVRSDWANAQLARHGADIAPSRGTYLIDNFGFVALRGTEVFVRLGLGRAARQTPAVYGEGPLRSGPARLAQVDPARFAVGQQNEAIYFDLLGALIARLQQAEHVHVVLIDEPFAPDAMATLDLAGVFAQTATRIAAFASDRGVPYLRPMQAAELTPEDFRDALHVFRGAPQRQVQSALARDLADYIQRRGL